MEHNSYLYWIHLEEHDDILSEGYVGITDNPKIRFNTHINSAKKGKNKVSIHIAINKHGIENIIFSVICKSTRIHVAHLEEMFRPNPKIGWNTLQGGENPGRLGLPQTTNQRIMVSAALKGKRLSKRALDSAAIANSTRIRSKSEINKRSLSISSKHLLDLSTTNLDVLSRILNIYECYLMGHKQYKTSEILSIPYCGMRSMFKRFDKGYDPNYDKRILEFIENYLEKNDLYKATKFSNINKPIGVFKTKNGSFIAYLNKNNKRYSKIFSLNEYGENAYSEACNYRALLENAA